MPIVETVKQNVTIITGYVTTTRLQKLFDRSIMTIGLWRQHEGLPYVTIPSEGRQTIRYVMKDVIKWGRENGKRMRVAEANNHDHDKNKSGTRRNR